MKRNFEWECPQCDKEGNKFKVTASKIRDLDDLIEVHNNKIHIKSKEGKNK